MFEGIQKKIKELKIDRQIKQKIAKGEDIVFDLDKIRNSKEYLTTLIFGIMAELDNLTDEGKIQIEIHIEEIPNNSFPAVVDFIKSKDLYDLVKMDFLIDQVDKEFEKKLNDIIGRIRSREKK